MLRCMFFFVVSYQALLSEVLALRKGMDILRFEKEKQEDNDILNNFYTFAHGKVQEVRQNIQLIVYIALQKDCCLYLCRFLKQLTN